MHHGSQAAAGHATPREVFLATLAYTGMALLMTWPLALGLGVDIPSDLGDPALNVFILGRNLQRFESALRGHLEALRTFWDARIFHPEPLSLAYSEHLLAQSLLVLPVRLFSDNAILAYNAAFLASFVLSALGAYLLARELLGRSDVAFLTGLLFGFAPYRVDQLSHIQVLSSQWMPFVLLGLLRYARSARLPPLAFACAALVAQNLSCGYYALFFPPFAAALGLAWVARGGQASRPRTWVALALAAVAVAALTLPALLPYAEARRLGIILREPWEVERFSADVYSYLTAAELLTFWGRRLHPYEVSEGALFPGLITPLLAALAIVGGVIGLWRRGAGSPLAGRGAWSRRLVVSLGLLVLATLLLFTTVLLGHAPTLSTLLPWLGLRRPVRLLVLLGVSTAALLAASPRLRAAARAALRSDRGLLLAGLVAAAWLSLGPTPRSFGRPLPGLGLYGFLYAHVPGFDGLRVPARFAMLVSLFLSLLAGYGATVLVRRLGRACLVAAGLLFLVEATPAPLLLNDVWAEPGLRPPPPRLLVGADAPAIYGDVARLPSAAVIAELPFGSDPWELRYMIASLGHGRRLVNGFSGAQPASYRGRREALRDPVRNADDAVRALAEAGATHVIVHERTWVRPQRGARATRLLEERGARRLAEHDGDVLLALPTPRFPSGG
jgi:hypothetical protein